MNELRKERIELVLRQYYKSLGIERNDRSRLREQVMARAAMIVALRKYLTCSDAGRVFGKDHSSTSYHTSNHKVNITHWPGYAEVYKEAERLCQVGLELEDTAARIELIDNEIEKLQTIKQNLIKIIQEHEQLQVQDH